MSAESEMNQNMNDIVPKLIPLTQEERDYFTSLMREPDSTCRELNDYCARLLGYSIHTIYIDNHYYVVGSYNILWSRRSWTDLGETPTQAKRQFYIAYLLGIHIDPGLSRRTMSLLRKACNAYREYVTAYWDLVHKLKLKDINQREFIDIFEMECRANGGTNCENIMVVLWLDNKAEQILNKFDPDRSPESIHQEFMPKPKPKREPKKKSEVKPEQKSKGKPGSPPQELINFD